MAARNVTRVVRFVVVAATLTWGGAILPVSSWSLSLLYKMMPLGDVRLQVIRILRGHAAELQQAAHARRRVRALEQKKNLEG